jgi:alkylation response protein AidB-like acyl-CoA dehydrogenase
MLEYGTDAQKARYLPAMARGEEIWCQGWSEPDAGSDLASIRSRATPAPQGGGWHLNGQKTWCSRGVFAEWCFGIFRTDPEAERHRGLTYFLIPMDAPGVTVRPIAQIDGETGFAEVFFEDVFVPDDQVLGGVGEGWRVAMSTAGSERGLSLRSPARYTEAATRLVALYDEVGRPGGGLADDVARAYVDAHAYDIGTWWTATRASEGLDVGPESSVNKIFWSETDLALQSAALRLLGPSAEVLGAGPEGPRPGEWLDAYLFALAGPIYAGANEIQRNLVGERLLGLPRG